MKALTSIAALTLLMSFAVSAPVSAASPQCGLYGMSCGPMDKSVKHTKGMKSKECGQYGMACAPADTAPRYTSGMKSKQCGLYGMNC